MLIGNSGHLNLKQRNMKPVKIFELKMDDWMKGLSSQASIAVGGLFSSGTNFDPFEISGMMQCSLASVVASDLSITNTPTVLTSWSQVGTAKLYAHTPNKIYEVLDGTPYTTVEKTAQISVATAVRGAIIYQGKYVYSLETSVRSNTLPVASASDIRSQNGASSSGIWHPLVVGADKNLYQMDFETLNKITNTTVADSGSNTLGVINLEAGMYARHAVNDGRYLVILADNNPTGDYNIVGGTVPPVPIAGNYRCQVLYWDMVKSTFDQIFEFNDSYLIGGALLDSAVYVFSGNGIYVTNIATAPKQIFSFKAGSTITEKPQNPFQITQSKNSIYWTGQSNGSVYAYGSLFPGMKKVFYQPFASNYTSSAITNNGTNFYMGTSGTDNFLRVTGTGSARNTGSVITAPIVLPNPYKFAFAKVVMQQPLDASASVDVSVNSNNGNKVVTASNTKAFSQVGSKQSLIFERKSSGGADPAVFEDFQLLLSSNRAVARVELWAYPVDDYSQTV